MTESKKKYKTIEPDKFLVSGFIKKTHGLHGEMTIHMNDGSEDAIDNSDFLMINIEGLLAPFKIETLYFRSEQTANIKFEDIDTQEQAKELVTCEFSIDRDLFDFEDLESSTNMLVGFTIFDQNAQKLGDIQHIEDFSGNLVATISTGDEDGVMVPLNDDLIIEFNEDEKKITINCPDGLFNTND